MITQPNNIANFLSSLVESVDTARKFQNKFLAWMEREEGNYPELIAIVERERDLVIDLEKLYDDMLESNDDYASWREFLGRIGDITDRSDQIFNEVRHLVEG